MTPVVPSFVRTCVRTLRKWTKDDMDDVIQRRITQEYGMIQLENGVFSTDAPVRPS